VDLDAVQVRILGCLLEKQRTTPDAYPLSLNALRLACNQATNRDPVVAYEEPELREAIAGLSRKGLVRLASGPGSRAVKYRHLLDQELGASEPELALLAVLLLRGPQTAGELKLRSERLHAFASIGEVEEALGLLAGRGLAERLERRPGQKEDRYRQLVGDGGAADAPVAAPATAAATGDGDRVAELEERVARLEADLLSLRRELGAEPPGDPQA
jgi:uncharacterized protein YceH (UPF0502 family)